MQPTICLLRRATIVDGHKPVKCRVKTLLLQSKSKYLSCKYWNSIDWYGVAILLLLRTIFKHPCIYVRSTNVHFKPKNYYFTMTVTCDRASKSRALEEILPLVTDVVPCIWTVELLSLPWRRWLSSMDPVFSSHRKRVIQHSYSIDSRKGKISGNRNEHLDDDDANHGGRDRDSRVGRRRREQI